jgi:hypothetical protein
MKSKVTRRARSKGAARAGASTARRVTHAHATRSCAARIVFAPASQARVNHGCKIAGTGIFTGFD